MKIITSYKSDQIPVSQRGFTLIEMMIVVAVIGILAAIAYPSYQQYIIKTKRTDMMTEMQNIASEIQARKLAQGSYSDISQATITEFTGDYFEGGEALYTVSFTPNPLTFEWTITATPKNGSIMVNDGVLSLNYQNNKCRASICSTGDDWNK